MTTKPSAECCEKCACPPDCDQPGCHKKGDCPCHSKLNAREEMIKEIVNRTENPYQSEMLIEALDQFIIEHDTELLERIAEVIGELTGDEPDRIDDETVHDYIVRIIRSHIPKL